MAGVEKTIEQLAAELTPNRRIFCDEYIFDRNGSRAYLVAYPNVKNAGVAAAAASRLLKDPKVAAYIEAKLAEMAVDAEIRVIDVLAEEKTLAFSDIRKLFEDGETLIPPGDLPDAIAGAVASFEKKERNIYGRDGDIVETVTTYKYKLWNKGAALKRLGEHLGMYQPEEGGLSEGLDRLGERLAAAIERSNKK